MVARTEADIQRKGISNVIVAQMGVESLDLPADSFDASLSGSAMHILPQPERALSEIWRVLKPDGCLPSRCRVRRRATGGASTPT